MEAAVAKFERNPILWYDSEIPPIKDPVVYAGLLNMRRIVDTAEYDVPTNRVLIFDLQDRLKEDRLGIEHYSVLVSKFKEAFTYAFQRSCLRDENGRYVREVTEQEIKQYCSPLIDRFLQRLHQVAPDFPGVKEAWVTSQQERPTFSRLRKPKEVEKEVDVNEEEIEERFEKELKGSETAIFRLLKATLKSARTAHSRSQWQDLEQQIKQAEHLVELLSDLSVDVPNKAQQEATLEKGNDLLQQMLGKAGIALQQKNWHLMDLHMEHTSTLAKLLSSLACYHAG